MNQPPNTAASLPTPGKVIVLTFPRGAGKSTVARLPADRLSPSAHLLSTRSMCVEHLGAVLHIRTTKAPIRSPGARDGNGPHVRSLAVRLGVSTTGRGPPVPERGQTAAQS